MASPTAVTAVELQKNHLDLVWDYASLIYAWLHSEPCTTLLDWLQTGLTIGQGLWSLLQTRYATWTDYQMLRAMQVALAHVQDECLSGRECQSLFPGSYHIGNVQLCWSRAMCHVCQGRLAGGSQE